MGFHHAIFWVGNAKQAAQWYSSRFGFEHLAYSGLETGEREVCTHVVRNGGVVYALQSPLNPGSTEFGAHMEKHGDGVRDIVFQVEDARKVFEHAVSNGAKAVREPEEIKDENGSMIVATVQTYGDTVHTLLQNVDYTGPFMPGFKATD